ncbi:Uncharacterised protein [Streptococcus pneumoniae]|nr:Uncharacterised protein [Streptococcus pneumoniae]
MVAVFDTATFLFIYNCFHFGNNSKKPHALGRQTSEREASNYKKNFSKDITF